jgi:hypothetical protein
MPTLARDLAQYDHDISKQDADQEFRDDIVEYLDEIKALLSDLRIENLIKARDHAQYLKELINERCV